MFIVGINGSPNLDGSTAALVKESLKAAEEMGAKTQIINVSQCLEDLKQPFCEVCSSPCSGVCFENTKLAEAFEVLSKADGFILGSPVYFGTVSGQLKAFWDMTRKLRTEKALINKVGGCVSTAAARFGGQETTLRALHDMLLVQGCIIVADGHLDYDAGHHGACAQAPALQDENALKRAQIVGKRVYQVAAVTKAIRS